MKEQWMINKEQGLPYNANKPDENFHVCVDGNWYTKDMEELVLYNQNSEERVFVVPEGVKRLRESCFTQCKKNLEIVYLPSTLEEIGDFAMFGGNYIYAIVFKSIPKYIGEQAFIGMRYKNFCFYDKKPLFGLPKKWHRKWLGDRDFKKNCKIIWNYCE